MSRNLDDHISTKEPLNWQLHAITEALGDLTLTINDSLSVGRGSDNDVILGSKEVSRNHAELRVLNGQLYVKDLGSSNGTFINNQRIDNNHSKNLKDADIVSFASFVFQVDASVTKTLSTEQPVNEEVIASDNHSEKPSVASEQEAVKQDMITETDTTKPAIKTTSTTHDKTTKTALQEEADPDVLRAKQAATGQLSGTANLGQPKDLGTEGNNALDQAINNPAHGGQDEKKPSGKWFIWVFAIIIIIALALWLSNMGMA